MRDMRHEMSRSQEQVYRLYGAFVSRSQMVLIDAFDGEMICEYPAETGRERLRALLSADH